MESIPPSPTTSLSSPNRPHQPSLSPPRLRLTSFSGQVTQLTDWRGPLRNVTEFNKLQTLGEGTYGLVSRAEDPFTSQLSAIKAMKVTSNTDLDSTVLREIRLLQRLRHCNIVKLDEVVAGTKLGTTYLKMESCHQDLDQFLTKCQLPLGSRQIFRFFQQLMTGLEFLHFNQIIHRDLKPANLLLTEELELKIADFGMARSYTTVMTPGVVTLWYRAPELLLTCPNYDYAVDIWSAGMILGELSLGRPVLCGDSEMDQLLRITDLLGSPNRTTIKDLRHLSIKSSTLKLIPSERRSQFDTIFSSTFNWAYDTLLIMLGWDPYCRPSARKVLTSLR